MFGAALLAVQLLNQKSIPPANWQPLVDRPRNRRPYGPRTKWSDEFWLSRNDPANSNTMMKTQRELMHNQNKELLESMWRMDGTMFEDLLRKVRPYITFQDTNFRPAVPADYRLSMALKFMAMGDSQKNLAIQYRVSPPVVCETLPRVFRAICKVLCKEYLRPPNSPDQWREIASVFWQRWNYPNCIGSIDGKHIVVWMPARSGARYYTYKGFYSLILLAIVGPNYEFLWVDIGTEGRQGDSNIWEASSFKRHMDNGTLGLPPPVRLPGTDAFTCYHLVGDNAFQMTCQLMKPFGFDNKELLYRVFDYRLSRARRVVENAFGILSQRFRVYHTKINLQPSTCARMVMASCALHNMLRKKVGAAYVNPTPSDLQRLQAGEQTPFQNLTPQQMQANGLDIATDALSMRNGLSHYFQTQAGAVEWQNEMAYR